MRRRHAVPAALLIGPVGLLTLVAACSSGGDEAPPEVAERLTQAVEEIERADGLHVDMSVLYYGHGRNDPADEPDEASCVVASFEPTGTSEAGERLHMNFGTPHEDYENYGCLLGSTFTVDGTRVYAHTDERAPGTSHGLLSRVGETTPELIDELSTLETGSGTELANLVDTASGVEEVDDDTVVFDLDPARVVERAPADAATEEPPDAVTLTVEYHPDDTDHTDHPDDAGRIASLGYEITAGDAVLLLTYRYEAYGETQGVEIPEDRYLSAEVTRLTTLDELRAFVGLDRGDQRST